MDHDRYRGSRLDMVAQQFVVEGVEHEAVGECLSYHPGGEDLSWLRLRVHRQHGLRMGSLAGAVAGRDVATGIQRLRGELLLALTQGVNRRLVQQHRQLADGAF